MLKPALLEELRSHGAKAGEQPVCVPLGESGKYFATDHSPPRPWWKLW